MEKVRFGIIGLGGMGRSCAGRFTQGQFEFGELTAIADVDDECSKWAKKNLPEQIACYDSAEALIESGKVDAIYIATPHYDHPPIAIKGLQKGLHVLSEKPAGVYAKQVKEMNEAAAASDKVFGVMFNQRSRPVYQRMRELVQNGELGNLVRTNLVITDWFRSQYYYDNGGWRGTWKGEGGGVLLNQCPHNLDLWQWICGMPKRLIAFSGFGKHHNIEVEDELTAYVEYENGATGVFIASTGEVPGTNRFEIVGDRGKLILENDELIFYRTAESISKFSMASTEGFIQPEVWRCKIPAVMTSNEHGDIINDFIDAVRTGKKLLAPGEEGINSLEMSNGMLLSSWTGQWVDIPVDAEKFHHLLMKKIQDSTYSKPEVEKKVADLTGTF